VPGAKQFFGGNNACSYGCIGYGDCAVACPENAITVKNGLARVNTRLCIGCGICAGVCPNKIISVEPDVIRQVIMCSNHDKGAVTRKLCTRGCIACRKCERGCPTGAITVVDNLPVIDYDKCIVCGKCAEECPVKCISTANYKGAVTIAQEAQKQAE
jgi:Fe-S-cluster-containing hydrogenase component 2